ncbi:MAG TPA: hypothetical protein VHE30_05885 [Polyangiaceae bacterium]|nr:hypothetical protein [Polyangiaceae bacterium]
MSEPGVVRRVIIPVVLLGLTALGLLNTYGDSSDVQRLAAETACGGTACGNRLVEFSKSPFSHEYAFQIEKGGARVEVTCKRAMIFLGDYACVKK